MTRARALAVASLAGTLAIWGNFSCQSLACDLHAVNDFSLNLTAAKGHSTSTAINNTVSQINADVQSISYNLTDAYIRATGVPSHDVGPFPGNPNTPANQNFLF